MCYCAWRIPCGAAPAHSTIALTMRKALTQQFELQCVLQYLFICAMIRSYVTWFIHTWRDSFICASYAVLIPCGAAPAHSSIALTMRRAQTPQFVLQCVLQCVLPCVLQCAAQCTVLCVRQPPHLHILSWHYGVATISRLLKIIGLFYRIWSLL